MSETWIVKRWWRFRFIYSSYSQPLELAFYKDGVYINYRKLHLHFSCVWRAKDHK